MINEKKVLKNTLDDDKTIDHQFLRTYCNRYDITTGGATYWVQGLFCHLYADTTNGISVMCVV